MPDQLTAWQGLSTFYEKKKETSKEDLEHLVLVYTKLLEIFSKASDFIKYYSTSEKLVHLQHTKLQKVDEAIKTLEARIEFSKDKGKIDKVYYGQCEIIKFLSQTSTPNSEQTLKLKETLLKVINDDSKSIQNNEHMKMLIRLLNNLREMKELVDSE